VTTYLEGGWFAADSDAMRAEVLDGAVEEGGALLRQGIGPEVLESLAAQARLFFAQADPQMRGVELKPHHLDVLRVRLRRHTADAPALEGFVDDCVDHVQEKRDLLGLYLHFVHVARVMHLFAAARQEEAS
jgi:hypothetical protein